jgi:CRP/FNR family cyclic AMP-dependent transcriptional regulator
VGPPNPICLPNGCVVNFWQSARYQTAVRLGVIVVTNQVRIVPKMRQRRKRVSTGHHPSPRLRAIENYVIGSFSKERLLGHLSRPVLAGFEALSSVQSYPKGAILFVEGQEAHGVYFLSNGRVKLTANSADGKSLLFRIAEPGEVIGLPGAISGKTYVLTAEALEPIETNFISRGPFMQFLREHGEASLRVAEILNEIYHATFQEVRYLGLSGSAAEKLARFLLDTTASRAQNEGQFRATLALTHEEIAEIIGVARETVTRLFASFKREQLIEMHGSTLVITNRAGLEKLLRA